MSAPAPPTMVATPQHPRCRQTVRALVSLAVVAVVFVGVLPQVADFGDVWGEIRAMTPLEVATLVLAAVWNLISYLFVVLPASPGLSVAQGFVLTESTTAVSNTLPGGAAIGVGMTYAMYSAWGFPRSESALAILVAGIWDNFMKLGLPVLALALLAQEGDVNVQRVMAGLVGVMALAGVIGVFWLMLRSDEMACRVGDTAARAASWMRARVRRSAVGDWGDAAVAFRSQALRLLRRAWLRLTVGAVVSHLSLFAVLLLALRHVGVAGRSVSWIEALAAFAFVRLLTAIPVTPGGLGVVELGLTAALVTAGGEEAKIVAAVLVFRALTYLLPVPLGLASYVVWRRRSSWRQPPPGAAAPGTQCC